MQSSTGDPGPVVWGLERSVSADQPPLSHMRFVVAALLCHLTGLMTDRAGIVSFSARYSPVLDLSSSAKWVVFWEPGWVKWDVIYTPHPELPPPPHHCNPCILSLLAAGETDAISCAWWTQRLMDVCWLEGLIYLISSLSPHAFLLPKFLWLPRHGSQIYNLVKTSVWFKPQGRRFPFTLTHRVRGGPCTFKSQV